MTRNGSAISAEYTPSAIQAIFCRRHHQPSRPPLANSRPGNPVPAMGRGTARKPRISPPVKTVEWML
jgi:hypothetical protein